MDVSWQAKKIEGEVEGYFGQVQLGLDRAKVDLCILPFKNLASLDVPIFTEYPLVANWGSKQRIREFLIGRWLVKQLLCLPTETVLGFYVDWDPLLKKQVCLSHTKDWVALGLHSSTGSCGLDMVANCDKRFLRQDVQMRILENVDGLASLPKEQYATLAWSAKEAAFKCMPGKNLLSQIAVKFVNFQEFLAVSKAKNNRGAEDKKHPADGVIVTGPQGVSCSVAIVMQRSQP